MVHKVKYDDSALCCCEYINENNQRSHLLAVLCDCEAIDEAFERVFTRQSLQQHNIDKIMDTVGDRLRIPWPGGAKKVPLDVAAALCCVFFTIFLGSFSWTLTIVTYSFILPSLMLVIHQSIKNTVVTQNAQIYKRDKSLLKKNPRSRFYFSWLIVSLISLLFIYYTQVIAELKINALENFAFMSLVCVSCTCMYLVRATTCPGFESKSKEGSEESEIFESGAWRICGECQQQVPRQASHCYKCDTCFLLRDHHCVWLDTCISCVNDRWFVTGLTFGLMALCYGAQLSLTTACHPKLVDVYFTTILVPHICTNAFMNWRYSLSASAACYSIFLAVFVSVALVQQVVCMLWGVRLREFRYRHSQSRSGGCSVKQPFENCFRFWWRS
ncbi:palmitoyltransferase ZDHHC23-like isoform X1 [Scylla paramamosain]|uniref:palmitoyltransferase ZDHHC23-like isoform X1 n=2 Tax=Scylla paramamosain TaxID=85552 RepID=UPI003083D481